MSKVMTHRNDPNLPERAPDWLPRAVRLYLDHVVHGQSLRALARREGCNASTVLRLVRRYEARRDDPLLDQALTALALGAAFAPVDPPKSPSPNPPPSEPVSVRLVPPDSLSPDFLPEEKDPAAMTAPFRPSAVQPIDEATLQREARRVLRRLVEPGAFLAIAPDLEKAAVMRSAGGSEPVTTTTMERRVAQAFALKDWIACTKPGRISRYELTPAGRAALRRMVEGDEVVPGLAEAQSPFAGQHRDMAERDFRGADGARKARVNLAESPVQVLGRRRDKAGQPFLSADLVQAAERLREDFEVAQMGGPRVAQNWDRFLTVGDRGGFRGDPGLAEGPRAARDRVQSGLKCLTHPLDDLVLLVCCHLHGIETAEMRLGLTARSGKELLRVALTYLRRHYDETYGRSGPLIG